jgi:hypothetical protein
MREGDDPGERGGAGAGGLAGLRPPGIVGRVVLLVALGYLGFYVYGLVLGVFSPGEMIGFSAGAVLCAGAGVVHGIRIRRALSGPDRNRITRELQRFRETRGW